MARITIEDCIEQVSNRFQLVQMAAIRAKQLKRGASAYVVRDDNKEVVTALREIAAGIVKPDHIAEFGVPGSEESGDGVESSSESTPEAAQNESESPQGAE